MMLWQKSLHIIAQIDHVQSLLLASPRVLWAIWVLLWANSCGLIAVFQMVGLLKTLPENIMSKLIMSHLYSACVIKGSLASGNTFLLEKGKAAGKDINCSATTGKSSGPAWPTTTPPMICKKSRSSQSQLPLWRWNAAHMLLVYHHHTNCSYIARYTLLHTHAGSMSCT